MFPKRLIQSLHEKKYRTDKKLFLVEGGTSLHELLLSDYKIESLHVTNAFYEANKELLKQRKVRFELCEQGELEKFGTLGTNDAGIAIVHQKENTPFPIEKDELILALDDIRDPGNLGTIIRIADWYGIKKILASKTTTDRYNSKVIQASMGSFTRVDMYYGNLPDSFIKIKLPVYGAYLDGKDVHTAAFPKGGILLMGNEANGISDDVSKSVKEKITIPSYGDAESLNVGIATAIILDNWRRQSRE